MTQLSIAFKKVKRALQSCTKLSHYIHMERFIYRHFFVNWNLNPEIDAECWELENIMIQKLNEINDA